MTAAAERHGPTGGGRQIRTDAAVTDGGDGPEAAPRVLTWMVVKRIDPRLWDTWGHWWIEFGEESYGWWPCPCPMGWREALLGTRGVLNGIGTTSAGAPSRDAYHGEEPDHQFHPTLIVDKTDDQVRDEIRAFAHSYVGGFCWQWWWLRQPAENCRTFQDDMFHAVGLYEEPEYLYTRGSGCPFMYPLRRLKWTVIDAAVGAAAHVRSRLRDLPRGRGRELQADVAGATAAIEQHDDPWSLTDPKARARARIRGTLMSRRDDIESP